MGAGKAKNVFADIDCLIIMHRMYKYSNFFENIKTQYKKWSRRIHSNC